VHAQPDDVEPSLTGHPIGRRDAHPLIGDTVGFEAGLFTGRTPPSQQRHVVEELSFDPETRQLRRSYTATDPLYWTREQTGSNATPISTVPYFTEACEDLTIDEEAELGPRG
jgi:hypothetical protein